MKYILLVWRPELVSPVSGDEPYDPFEGIEVAGIYDSESDCEQFMAANQSEHPNWRYLVQPEDV